MNSALIPMPVSFTRIEALPRPGGLEADPPTVGRELDRVRQQVLEDLEQSRRVASNHAEIVRHLEIEHHALSRRRRPHGISRRAERRRQVDVAQLEPQPAGDGARDVEQILDEPRLRQGVALDHLECVTLATRRDLSAAQHRSHPTMAFSGVRSSSNTIAETRPSIGLPRARPLPSA
jgi:hypothetical protein